MAVAWKVSSWATNSWVGMNGGPPNAWRGATTPVPPPPAPVVTGGKGDNPLNIYKPTGLIFRNKKKPVVVEEVVVEEEVVELDDANLVVPPSPPIRTMAMAEIDFEIKHLMHKLYRTEEEELVLLVLLAASS